MHHPKLVVSASILVAAALACGGSDDRTPPADVEREIADAVADATGAAPSTDSTPCEILDDELLRAALDVPADAEISRSPSRHAPHPLCTVTWPKPNAAEIDEQRAARMMEAMQARLRGEEVEMPSFRTQDEVSLTLYEPPFDDPAAARAAFESAMRSLAGGITGSHEDVEVTFQADLVPVEGVGDEAMWAAKLRQLSVVDGTRIFHVGVNTGAEPDAELETAKEVARRVAAEL